MLTILAAALLAQSPVYDLAGPILSNPALKQLAFFEFAPLSGAGMGSSCPLPNWLLQSDNFTAAWVASQDSAPRAPTITANYDGVADRIQFPATTPPAQYSRVFQGISTGWGGGTATCSVEIKGTSGSGTIPVYGLTGFPTNKTICSFNATDYTTCSLTWTTTGVGGDNFYIGPSGVVGDGSFPAIDVLLRGAQCNAGSSRSGYIATTTAAMGQSITGAKGEALTFTRASTATCTKGSPTSGIANGDLVVMPSNQVRVGNPDGAGLALLVESSRQNSIVKSQQIDDAAWTKSFAGGSTIAVVTADYAAAPDGTTTAERVQVSACATAGDASVVFQNTTVANSYSTAYIKGTSGSGSVSVCQFPTGHCSVCAFNSSTWTRCGVAGAALATYTTIGCENQTGVYPEGSSTGAADFLLWGVQQELGAYATSYIPTTTVAVTRAGEAPSFSNPLTASAAPGSFSMAATGVFEGSAWSPVRMLLALGTPAGANTADLFINTDSKGYLNIWNNAVTLGGINTTNTLSVATTRLGAQVVGGTSGTMFVNGVSVATTGTPQTIATQPATLAIGSAASLWTDGYVRQVCVDPSPTRCSP